MILVSARFWYGAWVTGGKGKRGGEKKKREAKGTVGMVGSVVYGINVNKCDRV